MTATAGGVVPRARRAPVFSSSWGVSRVRVSVARLAASGRLGGPVRGFLRLSVVRPRRRRQRRVCGGLAVGVGPVRLLSRRPALRSFPVRPLGSVALCGFGARPRARAALGVCRGGVLARPLRGAFRSARPRRACRACSLAFVPVRACSVAVAAFGVLASRPRRVVVVPLACRRSRRSRRCFFASLGGGSGLRLARRGVVCSLVAVFFLAFSRFLMYILTKQGVCNATRSLFYQSVKNDHEIMRQ
jgi:hypothetical protein